jgi:ubiquinone/menaquinone biosynthesis C-methylase UbiE
VVQGDATALPFADGAFTVVTMCVMFFFLDRPADALREARRVLVRGGRLAVYTTGPELRGTPAAPEPLASRGHFHTDEELVALAGAAGFADAAVANEDGGQLLTARSAG